MPTILLTKGEREVLLHRLDIPDALADSLEEEFSWQEVTTASVFLRSQVAQGFVAPNTDVERAVLIDAIEGSSYLGVMADAHDDREITPVKFAAAKRIVVTLVQKLSAALDVKVKFPGAPI